MVDFKKIDNMIEIVEQGIIPEGYTNNQFFIEFFNTVQLIPLSKYLRTKGKDNKLPKLMNSKKQGKFYWLLKKMMRIKLYLKRKGYPEIPELDYKSIMLLRKTDLYSNWNKIISFLEGKGTVGEINQSTRKALLPQEIEMLENYIKTNLSIDEKELNWLLNKMKKVEEDKSIAKALKKLVNNL